MSSCPWCGDRSQGHSKSSCSMNPYRGRLPPQQSNFSTAIGLQAVSGVTAVRMSHNGQQNLYIQTPSVVYCRAHGCTSCTNPGQKHYCHLCGNQDSTHCAHDCHLNNSNGTIQLSHQPIQLVPQPIQVVQFGSNVRFAPTNVSPHGGIGFIFPSRR